MWQFLYGYVIMQAEGLALTGFVARLMQAGAKISHVRYVTETTLQLRLRACDVPLLIPLRRRYRCRIRFIDRCGLPFLWQKACRRSVLFVGAFLLLTTLGILSQRIWRIEITGLDPSEEEEFSDLLSEYGLSIGGRTDGDILIRAADDLAIRYEKAARVSLDREGILLTAKVAKALPQSDVPFAPAAGDLVSDRCGVITKAHCKRGTLNVSVGQTVWEGSVLILGHVQHSEDLPTYNVRADGEILAAVVYRSEAEFPKVLVDYRQTGEQEPCAALYVGGHRMLTDKSAFSVYTEEWQEEYSVATVGVPITLKRGVRYAFSLTEYPPTEWEAEQYAMQQARTQALEQIPKDAAIINIHCFLQSNEQGKVAVCLITAEETIGIVKEYHQ